MISIEKSFATHPKSIYWSSINNVKPYEVYKSTATKYWFDCPDCNHIFNSSLDNISCLDQWCPYCSNNKLCKNNDCTVCFNKSFMSSKQSKYWSIKNIEIPRDIFKKSNKIYLFDCPNCGHEFESSMNNIINNRWCPYCGVVCKRLCNDRECILCFNNSFYSNYNSLFWSNINDIHPRYVIKNSKKKYWFDCKECNHTFEASVDSIINNRWCPYCSSHKLCDSENCSICYNKSFKSINYSSYIVDININPRYLFKFSKNILKFNCYNCNHIFEASIHHISEGSGCPLCIYKTENKLYNWLLKEYNNVKRQIKYEWCKNKETNKMFIYDFEINNNILIELDGEQHFRQISNWLSPEIQKERDIYKIHCAIENNKHIIHIRQDDVYNDKNDWEIKLKNIINSLKYNKIPELNLVGIDSIHFN